MLDLSIEPPATLDVDIDIDGLIVTADLVENPPPERPPPPKPTLLKLLPPPPLPPPTPPKLDLTDFVVTVLMLAMAGFCFPLKGKDSQRKRGSRERERGRIKRETSIDAESYRKIWKVR